MSQSKLFPLSQAALHVNSLLQKFRCKNFFQTSVELELMRMPWSSHTYLCSRNFSAQKLLGTLLDEMSKPEGIKKVHFHIGNITGFLFKTFSITSCPHCNSDFSNEQLVHVEDTRHIQRPLLPKLYYEKNQSQQKIGLFPPSGPKMQFSENQNKRGYF